MVEVSIKGSVLECHARAIPHHQAAPLKRHFVENHAAACSTAYHSAPCTVQPPLKFIVRGKFCPNRGIDSGSSVVTRAKSWPNRGRTARLSGICCGYDFLPLIQTSWSSTSELLGLLFGDYIEEIAAIWGSLVHTFDTNFLEQHIHAGAIKYNKSIWC